MKVFDGRSATEEYMSTHSLTFSTPEMTLYLQTRDKENESQSAETSINQPINFSDLLPDIDETFKPTGAVTDMFNKTESSFSKNIEYSSNPESKFCIECGSKLRTDSKFCTKCGARQ